MRVLVLCFSLLLPSLASAADISGMWVGYYAYAPGAPIERVPCSMVLEQFESKTSGMMIERQTFDDRFIPGLPSEINGIVDGRSIFLVKNYFHQMNEDRPGVDYELTLSPDGNVLSGFWTIGDTSGTVFFRRVTATSADRIPAPVD